MIGFLDTSALVPLLLEETTSTQCRLFWETADDVTGSRVSFVEAAAALAQAERMGRIDEVTHHAALSKLERLWPEITFLDVDEQLVRRAAELARRYALRGYDAVQCASAEEFGGLDLVAASGDSKLLAAWADLGIATFDPSDPR